MKPNKILCFLLLTSVCTLLVQCAGEKKDDESVDTLKSPATEKNAQAQDVTTEAVKPQFAVDEIFRKQITTVFDAYVELKDAFVSSDAQKVTKKAAEIKEALAKVDMKLVSGAAHNDWMNYVGEMQRSLDVISSNEEIESQRASFSQLSDTLYKTIKAYGLSGTTAFYEFCPMAFDDKGAHWLSKEDKIRNPYFGDKMLTCGMVEETLRAE